MISLALESIICVIAIYSLRLADVKCLGLNSTQAGGYEVGELDGENLQSPVIHHPFNSWIRQSEIDVWFVIRLSVRFSSRNSQLSRALVVRSPQPQSLSRNLWTHQPSQIDLSCSRNNETFCDVRVCCWETRRRNEENQNIFTVHYLCFVRILMLAIEAGGRDEDGEKKSCVHKLICHRFNRQTTIKCQPASSLEFQVPANESQTLQTINSNLNYRFIASNSSPHPNSVPRKSRSSLI